MKDYMVGTNERYMGSQKYVLFRKGKIRDVNRTSRVRVVTPTYDIRWINIYLVSIPIFV